MKASHGFITVAMVCAGLSNCLHAAPPITALVFAPDGKSVVAGSQGGIEVRTWPDLNVAQNITTRLAHVHDLSFSPAGDVVAVAGGEPGESGFVELLRWPSGETIARHKLGDDVIYRVAWQPDGKTLATAGADRTVTLLRRDGTVLQRFVGHSRAVTAVAFLPADDRLVSVGLDQSVRLWNAATGELLRTFDNHTAAVHDVAVRPKNETGPPLIATAGADRTVRFWQPTLGRLVRFARLPSEPLAIAWTPDSRLVLAVCRDGRVRAIDPESAEIVWDQAALSGWAYTIAVAPDGKNAVVGGEAGESRRIPFPK